MYDPFAYLPPGYAYADHGATVDTLLQCWLTSTDTRLIAIPRDDAGLELMVERNPAWFTHVGDMPNAGWVVQAAEPPPVSSAECQAARAASR
jgi:hypothetical protein